MSRSIATLPDYLAPGLRVLFIGINPGLHSAAVGHHFAGPSNRFWKLLYAAGFVSEPLTYRDDQRLPQWGIGLTNVIQRATAGIDELAAEEYRRGRLSLEQKVARFRPRMVALLGVTIYRLLFTKGGRSSSPALLGPLDVRLAASPVFLLPNPSGRNAHYSYDQMLSVFLRLRKEVDSL